MNILVSVPAKYTLCKAHECLRQSNLSQHPVSRYGSLLGSIKEDVCLFFGVFIVIVRWTDTAQGRIIYRQVDKVGRGPVHVTVLHVHYEIGPMTSAFAMSRVPSMIILSGGMSSIYTKNWLGITKESTITLI